MRFLPVLLPLSLLAQSPATALEDYSRAAAYSVAQSDLLASRANPAALAQLRTTTLATGGERRYLVAGLALMNASLGFASRSGNFGLQLEHVQAKGFAQSRIALLYARKTGGRLDLGALFSYDNMRIGGYGGTGMLRYELAMILHLTDQVHAGLRIVNLAGEGRSANGGIGFDASEKFFAFAEVEKKEGGPGTVIAGFQYRFVPQCFLRAGISSFAGSCWIGAGFELSRFRFDVTSHYHPQLGFTPGLLLLFRFKKLHS